MAKVCKHCKYRNNDSASFCVRCGKTLSGTIAKVFVPQNEYELLKRKNLALEERVKSLEGLDTLRLESIKRLEKQLADNVTNKISDDFKYVLNNKPKEKLDYEQIINASANKITIKQSEYDNLRRRASMSLWEKFKETLGL